MNKQMSFALMIVVLIFCFNMLSSTTAQLSAQGNILGFMSNNNDNAAVLIPLSELKATQSNKFTQLCTYGYGEYPQAVSMSQGLYFQPGGNPGSPAWIAGIPFDGSSSSCIPAFNFTVPSSYADYDIFAMSFDSSTGNLAVLLAELNAAGSVIVVFDTTSNAGNIIQTIPTNLPSDTIFQLSSTIDEKNQVMYLQYSTTQRFYQGFDLTGAGRTFKPVANSYKIHSLKWDVVTGQLFGIAEHSGTGIAAYDPSTGTQSWIGHLQNSVGFSELSEATLDTENRILYAGLYNDNSLNLHLQGFSLKDASSVIVGLLGNNIYLNDVVFLG